MSGHTPGPWRLTENDEDGGFVIKMAAFDSGGPNYVHHRVEYAEMLSPGEAGWAVAEANARLIAAAPDLLEATKAHLEQCTEDTWQGLIDAVSKAEGK